MKIGEVNVPKNMVTYSILYRFNNKKGFAQTVTQRADIHTFKLIPIRRMGKIMLLIPY